MKSAVESARAFTPYAGQPRDEIVKWFRAKYPSGVTDKSSRAYARELYKTQPDQNDDPKGHYSWYDALTPYQRRILDDSKRQSNANSLYYQNQLLEKRQEYSAKVGRKVRPYRRGAKRTLTEDKVRAERRERNNRLRAHIRDELAAGRNPFDQIKFNDMTASEAKNARHSANWFLCDGLLKNRSFDTANDPSVAELAGLYDLSTEEVHRLIVGAIEVLRTVKAIRKKGGIVSLRDDLANQKQAETEQTALEALPHFGMF